MLTMLFHRYTVLIAAVTLQACTALECPCYTATVTVEPSGCPPIGRKCGPRAMCMLLETVNVPAHRPECPTTPTSTVTAACITECQHGCGTATTTVTVAETCLRKTHPLIPANPPESVPSATIPAITHSSHPLIPVDDTEGESEDGSDGPFVRRDESTLSTVPKPTFSSHPMIPADPPGPPKPSSETLRTLPGNNKPPGWTPPVLSPSKPTATTLPGHQWPSEATALPGAKQPPRPSCYTFTSVVTRECRSKMGNIPIPPCLRADCVVETTITVAPSNPACPTTPTTWVFSPTTGCVPSSCTNGCDVVTKTVSVDLPGVKTGLPGWTGPEEG